MSTQRVAVAGYGMFSPGYADPEAWFSQEFEAESDLPGGKSIEPRSRRRASVLARALSDAYCQAATAAGLEVSEVASVFGSALGEAGTMIGLLDQMWTESEELSPMRFATSVHNAASGIVSISAKNRGFTTSLGADFDTPAMALMEAMSWLFAYDEPVVVACADEAVPEKLLQDGEGWGLLSVALALVPVSRAPEGARFISVPKIAEKPTVHLPELQDPLITNNPQVGMLDVIRALRDGCEGSLRLDRGRGRGFCVDICSGSEMS